jgi:hypothetical protein
VNTGSDGLGSQHDCDQESRPVRAQAPQHDDQDQRAERDGDRRRPHRPGGGPQRGELGDELGRFVRDFQPEQVLQLARQDDRRDARGETGRHRIRDVFDVGAEPEQADDHHDGARHQGGEYQPVIAVALHRRGDQHDEGAGWSADLHPAAAEQRHEKPADDCRVEPPLRSHA